MALRLDDVKNPKTESKKNFQSTWVSLEGFEENHHLSQNAANDSLAHYSKVLADKLRPWQSFDDSKQTRTYAAREALNRAKKIREKNELMCAQLRQGYVSQEVEQKLKEIEGQREEDFNFDKVQLGMSESKIKTASSFVSFFRDLLKQ